MLPCRQGTGVPNFKPCKWRESRSIWQELELRYRLLHRWDGVDSVDSVDGWKVNFPVLTNLAVLWSYQARDFLKQPWRFFLLKKPVAGLCAATGTSSGRSSEAEGTSWTFTSKIVWFLVSFFLLRGGWFHFWCICIFFMFGVTYHLSSVATCLEHVRHESFHGFMNNCSPRWHTCGCQIDAQKQNKQTPEHGVFSSNGSIHFETWRILLTHRKGAATPAWQVYVSMISLLVFFFKPFICTSSSVFFICILQLPGFLSPLHSTVNIRCSHLNGQHIQFIYIQCNCASDTADQPPNMLLINLRLLNHFGKFQPILTISMKELTCFPLLFLDHGI